MRYGCSRGTGTQFSVATAAATLIENGFRLTYVASSPELAAAWLAEQVPIPPDATDAAVRTAPCPACGARPRRDRKPKAPWASVERCVREVHALYPTDASWDGSYQMYREMCRAKHGEARFLKDAGERLVMRHGEPRLRHEFGPLGSRPDAYIARRAVHASLYVAGIVCFAMIAAIDASDELQGLVDDALRLVEEPPMKPFLKNGDNAALAAGQRG
jgi:hypothetical protein